MNNTTNSILNAFRQVFDYPLFQLGDGAVTLSLILKLLPLLASVLLAEHVLRRYFTTRLRSTEIVTNDNISIIVPNSEFITHPVTN